ncbi:MAG: hypothetical protein ACK5P5_08500 [Pseudobdellovibrionaceae bacterium]
MNRKLSLFFSHSHFEDYNFAVMDSQFRTLWSHHNNPTLKLHLSLVAENFLKFIKPNKNEMFWSNSNQVGSLSTNSHLFFARLMTVGDESVFVVFDMTIFGFKAFPPVPLELKPDLNHQGLTINQLATQFSLGVQSAESISSQIQEIQNKILFFIQLCLSAEKKFKLFSGREEIFTEQKKVIKHKFKDNPVSTVNQQQSIDGTLVKLHLIANEDQIVFDFSQTQMKKTWGWPESLTNSLCYFFASQFFPIQDAHHASFSFLKIIHSQQSPLAAKDFSFDEEHPALQSFFLFLTRALEATSNRFIWKKENQWELMADRQVDLFIPHEKGNALIKMKIPSAFKQENGRISIFHLSKWQPFSKLLQICPECTVLTDQKMIQLALPPTVQVLGWKGPSFAKSTRNDHGVHLELTLPSGTKPSSELR